MFFQIVRENYSRKPSNPISITRERFRGWVISLMLPIDFSVFSGIRESYPFFFVKWGELREGDDETLFWSTDTIASHRKNSIQRCRFFFIIRYNKKHFESLPNFINYQQYFQNKRGYDQRKLFFVFFLENYKQTHQIGCITNIKLTVFELIFNTYYETIFLTKKWNGFPLKLSMMKISK